MDFYEKENASLDLCYHLIVIHNSLSQAVSRVCGGGGGDGGGDDGRVCVRFVRACVRRGGLKMTPRQIHEDGLAIVAKVKLIAQAVIEQVGGLYTSRGGDTLSLP